jgi:hypothetical protein
LNKRNTDLSTLNNLLLDTVPTRETFDNIIDLLFSECEVLTANPDKLFDEYIYLHRYLLQKESERFNSNGPSKKRSEMCVHLKENNVPHGNMKNVELLLCLPGSNASIERVHSHINYIWSEEKSRFHVDKINAILAVTTYVNLPC